MIIQIENIGIESDEIVNIVDVEAHKKMFLNREAGFIVVLKDKPEIVFKENIPYETTPSGIAYIKKFWLNRMEAAIRLWQKSMVNTSKVSAEDFLKPYIERPFRHTEVVDKDNALKAMEQYVERYKKALSLCHDFLRDVDIYGDQSDRSGFSVAECSNIATNGLNKLYRKFPDLFMDRLNVIKG